MSNQLGNSNFEGNSKKSSSIHDDSELNIDQRNLAATVTKSGPDQAKKGQSGIGTNS